MKPDTNVTGAEEKILDEQVQNASNAANDEVKKTEIDMSKDEEGVKLRVLKGVPKQAIAIFAILSSLFHIFSMVIYPLPPMVIYGCHWGLAVSLVFIFYPFSKKVNLTDKKAFALDVLLCLITLAIVTYIVVDTEGLMRRYVMVMPTKTDLVLGALTILLSIEACRRTSGNGLPIVAILLLLVALFGEHLPSVISNSGFSLKRIITFLFSNDGIFGTALQMSATKVFLLVVFGAFLEISGVGKFFMDLALSLAGASRGGPAKVAVISSAFFGSMSGSSVANVVGTGTFTIPMMKRIGYRPEFAAAVEAVASTGGQIMPPVMGSAAFIMAELIGMPYYSIALAALIPALIYYYSVFLSIDFEAAKTGLKGMPKEDLERPMAILKREGHLLIPIVVLVYCIGFSKFSIAKSATISIISCVLSSWLSKSTRMGVKDILKALELGFMRGLPMVAAVACAGVVIGCIMLTGLGMKITYLISLLAGNSLFLALLFSAVTAIVLGMGMPTVAAYVVCASILGSSLTGLGLEPLAAHMFLMYYSVLSVITPPVALAAYTAANIAQCGMTKTGLVSVRLAAVAFVLPFFFVYGNALLLMGSFGEIVLAIISSFIGVTFLTIALYGHFLGSDVPWYLRIMLIGGASCMIIPGFVTDIIGFALVIVFTLVYKPMREYIISRIGNKKEELK